MLAPRSLAPERSAVLTQILVFVDVLWHEVAKSLPYLNPIPEDPEKLDKTLRTAAAVAIQVFFHLEDPAQVLNLDLEGGRGGELQSGGGLDVNVRLVPCGGGDRLIHQD